MTEARPSTPSPRQTMIDIAKRRQRPGTGSNLQRGDTALREWPDLTDIFRDIPWAVVGAVATRNYMPERATQTLDILARSANLRAAESRFKHAGFEKTGTLTIGGSTWRLPDGTPVDLIEGRSAWVDQALQLAATNRDQQGLPVLTLPYLVLMKMESDRLIDSGDIGRMLGLADDDAKAATRAVVTKHGADLMEDLESIITLGELEFGAGPPE